MTPDLDIIIIGSVTSLTQPLLDSNDRNPQILPHRNLRPDQRVTKYFKISSIVLGLIIGLFIQFSTLGANWLIISMFGEEAIVSASGRKLVLYSFLWSIVTSAMSMWMLKYLRDLVNLIQVQGNDNESGELVRRRHEFVLQQLESRFVCGALMGVNFAWILTDMLLGLHVEMMYSFVTFLLAAIWSWFLLSTFGTYSENESELPSKNNSHQQVSTKGTFASKSLSQVIIV